MHKKFLILILLLGSFTAQARKLENVAILIPSCDKYAELWSPFFHLLHKYWPGLEQPIYMISNTKKYPDVRVQHIMIPQEKSWSDNMLHALNQIPEEYVMIILEDYFITEPVKEERLESLYNQMRKEKAAYLGLVDVSNDAKIPHPSVPGLGYLPPKADYRNSLQACIWKKDILKTILKAGENPWRFELYGAERTQELKEPFLCVSRDVPIAYFGAVYKGHWNQAAIQFLKDNNLVIKHSLPIETDWQKKKFQIWSWISRNITYPIKRFFGIKWHLT